MAGHCAPGADYCVVCRCPQVPDRHDPNLERLADLLRHAHMLRVQGNDFDPEAMVPFAKLAESERGMWLGHARRVAETFPAPTFIPVTPEEDEAWREREAARA